MKKRWMCLLMPVFISICISCSKKQHYFIVEFTGKGEVYNGSKESSDGYYADSVNTVFILAEPGDNISLNDHPFYFQDTSIIKYAFESKDTGFYINGKIYSYEISSRDSLVEWYDELMSKDISGLEFINITFPLPENYLPFLEKIGSLKQNIGIVIDDNLDSCYINEEVFNVLENFNPRFLQYSFLTVNKLKELARFDDLEVLELILFDTTLVDPVPPLPHLKKLKDLTFYIFNYNEDKDSIIKKPFGYLKNFLENNTQIERLTILDLEDSMDISFISPLKRLKRLIINSAFADTLTLENIQTLRETKHLEFVHVDDYSGRMDTIFNDLTHIRWFNLYPYAIPTDLNTIIKFHPDLEVMTIYNDTIQSFQPLLGLPGLYGLIILDTLTDRNTILSMKNLKYLSVPLYLKSDSLYFASLQDSLPGCKIVFNEKLGGCLGSGWLFLLIPFILLFSFLGRLKFSNIPKYFIF